MSSSYNDTLIEAASDVMGEYMAMMEALATTDLDEFLYKLNMLRGIIHGYEGEPSGEDFKTLEGEW